MSAAAPLRRLVGVDLGGTAIKAGAVSSAGEVLGRREVPAEVERGANHVVLRIAELARELGCEGCLGLGAPGLLDRAGGRVIESPNLAPLSGFRLRAAVASALGLQEERVLLENDANVAAVGEHWIGGARGERDVLVVTLGTGVGGGLILDGRLFVGEGGMAGEVGHMVVEPGGPRCGCGRRGCLEQLASATAAGRRARAAGLPGDMEEVSALASSGDARARTLLHEVGRDLGRGLALCVTLLDLRSYLIGGGFGAALELMRAGIEEGIAERSFGRAASELRIRRATLGGDAGWIGAARLAGE